MPGWIDIRQYMRAARQRLRSGEALRSQDQWLDAIYLAGYAVECALKALLLSNLPVSRRRRTSFTGRGWHDFERLKFELSRRGVNFPPAVVNALRTVRTWSTDLRYSAGPGNPSEALDFLESATIIVHWVEERLE